MTSSVTSGPIPRDGEPADHPIGDSGSTGAERVFPDPDVGPVVVVGAGTAGCVVTRRLAEHGHRVVLLEAGPATAPANDRRLTGLDHLEAQSVPDRWWRGVRVRRSAHADPSDYLLGRGLGGSSAVNGAMAEADLTDPALGPPGEVREAHRRLLVHVESADVGEAGPLGRTLLDDRHGRLVSLARLDGRRHDAATAYLADASDRIDVRGDTIVERIERSDTATFVVTARSERIDAAAVVLCAGAIHTPTILLRSGLGSRVGEHLQDHPSIVLDVVLRRPVAASGLVTAAVAERDGVQLLPLERIGPPPSRRAALLVALMEPDGDAGTVIVDADDPSGAFHVDFHQDRSRRDVDRLAEGVRWATDLMTGPEASAVVAEVALAPGSHRGERRAVHEVADAELRDRVVTGPGAYFHAAASCGIGRSLDANGRLIDAGPVFVADAAAFPRIPRTGTHLPTLLLAERLAGRWTRGRMAG